MGYVDAALAAHRDVESLDDLAVYVTSFERSTCFPYTPYRQKAQFYVWVAEKFKRLLDTRQREAQGLPPLKYATELEM